jgi:hypothetical protein
MADMEILQFMMSKEVVKYDTAGIFLEDTLDKQHVLYSLAKILNWNYLVDAIPHMKCN